MKAKILIMLILLLAGFSSAQATINPSFSYLLPVGDWAKDRFSGGASLMFTLELRLGNYIGLFLPEVGYGNLGKDELMIKAIETMIPEYLRQGYDLQKIKSNIWMGGIGLRVKLLPDKLATPYIQGGYYLFRRGITLGSLPLPMIPGYTDQSRISYNHGFGIDSGVILMPEKLISATIGVHYFFGKGAGTNDIDTDILHMPRKNAQFLLFHAGIDLF
jgi:hypothetical protein